MRNRFGELMADALIADPNVWLLSGDLGFGVLNRSREVAPDRALNVGAAEPHTLAQQWDLPTVARYLCATALLLL